MYGAAIGVGAGAGGAGREAAMYGLVLVGVAAGVIHAPRSGWPMVAPADTE